MRNRTPQEKKQLSLKKDRRNVYGEGPHGARKNIPFRKKLRNRANRHLQESGLPTGPVPVDSCDVDEIETAMLSKAPVVWNKSPDAPLREVIPAKQKRRATPRHAAECSAEGLRCRP